MAETESFGQRMAEQFKRHQAEELERLRNPAYAWATFANLQLVLKTAAIIGRDMGYRKLQLCQGGDNFEALARERQAYEEAIDKCQAIVELLKTAHRPATDGGFQYLRREAAGQKVLDLKPVF